MRKKDIRIESLDAYDVLLDVKRAHSLLDDVDVTDDEQLFRIYWYACLSLLRTVAEVLKHDVCANPSLKAAWGRRFKELNSLDKEYKDKDFYECPEDYLYWTRLFQMERNFIVHEYKSGVSECAPLWLVDINQEVFDGDNGILDNLNIYRPMEDIDMFGNVDCRDLISDAISWWENELKKLIQNPSEEREKPCHANSE